MQAHTQMKLHVDNNIVVFNYCHSLDCNSIGNAGAEALGQALQTNRTLTTLRLVHDGTDIARFTKLTHDACARYSLYGNKIGVEMPFQLHTLACVRLLPRFPRCVQRC